MYFYYILVLIFCVVSTVHSEGFCARTLVKTPSGYTPIELLSIDDEVIAYDNEFHVTSIIAISSYEVDWHIELVINEEIIKSSVTQRFYDYACEVWVPAHTIEDTLSVLSTSTNENSTLKPFLVHQKCKMYVISLKEFHAYCVSKADIVVHNSMPVATLEIVASIPHPVVQFVAQAATVIGSIGYFVYSLFKGFKQSKKHRNIQSAHVIIPQPNLGYNNCDPEDPRTMRYEDASYHHQNSKGCKSAAPRDGRAALDSSVPIINTAGNGRHRITVQDGKVIFLKWTGDCKYHGYTIEPDDLEKDAQDALVRHRLAKSNGKKIKIL